jgi:hypothetical protein
MCGVADTNEAPMTSMIETAASDNGNAQAELLAAFGRVLDERVGPEATFAAREVAGLALANTLCRADQEKNLRRRAEGFGTAAVVVDGKEYRRHETGRVVYHGLCGGLNVERYTYREVGVHNGRTIVPLELEAGLMERATPALAYALGEGHALADSRKLEKTAKSVHRVLPSRSTTERIAKALGAAMTEALPRIEPVVRAEERVPEVASAIVPGIDRTSTPMREPREDGTTAPRRARTRPYEREAPDPIDVNYRMSYVGTVSLVDAHGEALVTRRYGIGAHAEPETIVARMMADLRAAHAQRPDLLVGVVQDGAPEMWNLVRAGLAEESSVTAVGGAFEAIDRHHLLERLCDALLITKHTPAHRERKRHEWSDALDRDADAIEHIEAEIIALHQGHRGQTRKKLYEHRTYIENNKDRMRYANLIARGLPIGSGATEGACKSLVQVRAKGCGQRWLPNGLDAVLVLRGLEMSDRLPAAFRELACEYQAVVLKRAA